MEYDRARYAAMSVEQQQELRERCRASNNQCSSIERERESRDLLEEGTWIGLDEKRKVMKMHRKGWVSQKHDLVWLAKLVIMLNQIIFQA